MRRTNDRRGSIISAEAGAASGRAGDGSVVQLSFLADPAQQEATAAHVAPSEPDPDRLVAIVDLNQLLIGDSNDEGLAPAGISSMNSARNRCVPTDSKACRARRPSAPPPWGTVRSMIHFVRVSRFRWYSTRCVGFPIEANQPVDPARP